MPSRRVSETDRYLCRVGIESAAAGHVDSWSDGRVNHSLVIWTEVRVCDGPPAWVTLNRLNYMHSAILAISKAT